MWCIFNFVYNYYKNEKTSLVVEKLRSEILPGILEEQSPLREMHLAKRFNVGKDE